MPIVAPLEVAEPVYRIYRYTDRIFKLVKYKRRASYTGFRKKSEKPKYTDKLAASLARTRRIILEYALCNYWEYFCTFTISKDQFDRSDLITWRDTFLQWIRDNRKKGIPIVYLLVPELHKDGAWHMHGFFTGIQSELVSFKEERRRGLKVPDKLVNGDFYDWPAYRQKFGFCSFAPVRDRVASAFYVLKYLTKDMASSSLDVGLRMIYATRGLNRCTVQTEVYAWSKYLDSFLENDYKFCQTGMTKTKHNLDWTFGLEYGCDSCQPLSLPDWLTEEELMFEPLFEQEHAQALEAFCDDLYEVSQLTFDDLPV